MYFRTENVNSYDKNITNVFHVFIKINVLKLSILTSRNGSSIEIKFCLLEYFLKKITYFKSHTQIAPNLKKKLLNVIVLLFLISLSKALVH